MKCSRTRAGVCAWLLIVLPAATLPVQAQTIPVTTPRLPPRGGAAVPAPAAQPGAQGAQGAQPTPQSSAQGTMQAGRAGFGQGTTPPGAYTGTTAPTGAYASQAPTGAYASQAPTGAYASQAPTGAYASPAPAGYAPYGTAPPPPAPTVVPQRATAGNCRAQPTPDRQTVVLVSGAEALARAHLPLGEFRAQQVVHSPDGRWAVVYTKQRGAASYAAMTIDLERCELQRVVELSAAGEDVRFDGDDAVLRLAGSERRVGLRDGRVR